MGSIRKLGPYFHKRVGYWYFVFVYPDGSRKMVYEHRELYEKKYGPLKAGRVVHHANERKTDNCITNLEALTRGQHTRLHHATGRSVVILNCRFCGKKFEREKRQVHPGRTFCSRTCLWNDLRH